MKIASTSGIKTHRIAMSAEFISATHTEKTPAEPTNEALISAVLNTHKSNTLDQGHPHEQAIEALRTRLANLTERAENADTDAIAKERDNAFSERNQANERAEAAEAELARTREALTGLLATYKGVRKSQGFTDEEIAALDRVQWAESALAKKERKDG